MTPFDTWYSANIAATLPRDFPPSLEAQARKQLSACWNAALQEAESRVAEFFRGADNEISGNACVKHVQGARITP